MDDENRLWQKLTAELIGTAFLVFVGVGSVPALALARGGEPFTGAELGFISLSFALIVVVTVYVFGYISGNHINPAVTLALAVTGKFPWKLVLPYIVAQIVGATLGAVIIIGVMGPAASELGLGVASYGPDTPWLQAGFAEFMGTFLLVFGVFGVIYRKAALGWAGLVIGFVVFAAIIPVAPVTGASINPARTIGPMIVQQLAGGVVQWEQLPVYLIAEFLGGIAGGVLFGVIAHTAVDRTPAEPARDEYAANA
ncbi:MAG: MIP/aquaporin family protein [Microbacterium sp.]